MPSTKRWQRSMMIRKPLSERADCPSQPLVVLGPVTGIGEGSLDTEVAAFRDRSLVGNPAPHPVQACAGGLE